MWMEAFDDSPMTRLIQGPRSQGLAIVIPMRFIPYVVSSDFNRSGCFQHQEMVQILAELILTRQD